MIVMLLAILMPIDVYQTYLILHEKKMVIFDMQGSVKAFEQQLSTTNLSQDQQTKLITQFLTFLNNDTNNYAKEHGAVILVSGAVVGGALPDITQSIQEELALQVKQVWPAQGS